MRLIYTLTAAGFTVLALIFAFQNTSIIVPSYFFLKTLNVSLFLPFLILFFCGVGAGFFLSMSLSREDVDEDDF